MSLFDEITQSLVGLDVSRTADLTKETLEQGEPALELLNQGLLPAMKIIGDRFQSGEFFLPELILAGRAMQAAMAHLKPAFQREGTKIHGKVAIGTVKEDIHDIGKNLVLMMLEGNGWDVVDLGVDVEPEQFCAYVKENDPDIIGLSALLTTTIPSLSGEITNCSYSLSPIKVGAIASFEIALHFLNLLSTISVRTCKFSVIWPAESC